MAKLGSWDDVTDDFVLPPGDPKRGAKLFKKHCQQCHSLREDNRQSAGYASIGPTLFNVYGRTAGTWSYAGNNKMSPTLQRSGIIWNDANLMRYMKKPEYFVDETIAMNFAGLSNFKDRVDIVHFLKTLKP